MAKLPKFLTGLRNCKHDVKATGIRKYHFTKSEWSSFRQPEKVSVPYMVWRGIYMSFFCFAVPNSILAPQTGGNKYWLIYLTNWSLLTQLIYGILFFIDNLIACSSDRSKKNQIGISPEEAGPSGTNTNSKSAVNQEPEPNVENEINNSNSTDIFKNVETISCVQITIWILFNITGTLPIFVTLGYWLTIYGPIAAYPTLHQGNYNIFMVHGINAVLAIIDSMVVALPVRASHFIYVVPYGAAYIVFSIIYEIEVRTYPAPGQPYIYPLLNWRHYRYLTVLACFVALLVYCSLHVTLWLRYVFRLYLVSKISCRKDKEKVYDYHYYYHKYTQPKDSNDSNDGTHLSASNLTSETSNVPEPTSQSLTEVISDLASESPDVRTLSREATTKIIRNSDGKLVRETTSKFTIVITASSSGKNTVITKSHSV